ncbi:hypothetical protein ACO0LO_18525 [Undibacterium sp. TJN25]|uniref:hypothetical protein n=1 Tax=Undibacterium sp. TJN25 TaxID=3413056 RepID=UPI003BF0D430
MNTHDKVICLLRRQGLPRSLPYVYRVCLRMMSWNVFHQYGCCTFNRLLLILPIAFRTQRAQPSASKSKPASQRPARRKTGPHLFTTMDEKSMRAPHTVRSAEEFGRARLSHSFFMRDFLYSEIASINGMANLPDNPDLAIAAGSALCQHLLEPLQATFGRLAIRSSYRSPEVNSFGCAHRLSCASNEKNRARHTWDTRSKDGGMGALACIVIPWLVDRLETGISWQAMAWWIHDNLPYSDLQFFPKLAAFNIGWHENPKRTIYSFIEPRGFLTKPGFDNHNGDHSHLYPGFPELVRVAPFGPGAGNPLGNRLF